MNRELVIRTLTELSLIRMRLAVLSERLQQAGEGRIGFEVHQGLCALGVAEDTAKDYLTGESAPSLEELQAMADRISTE